MKYPNGLPDRIIDGFCDPGILVVSGSGPNKWGHALLRLATLTGYAHVHEIYSYPDYIDGTELEDYLSDEGKTILGEINIHVPNLAASKNRLREAMQSKWFWKAIRDNCVSFCVDVLNAGGADLPNDMSLYPSETLIQVLRGATANNEIPELDTGIRRAHIAVGPQTASQWIGDQGL